MTEKNPSQSAMDKILQGEVKQIPKWHFVVKNIALWLVGILCVLAGSITVSLIIFTVANSALALRGLANRNLLQHIIIIAPMLWVSITIIFIWIFDLFIRHTKKGYKYSIWMIVLINIVVSIVAGSLLYVFGVSHIVDNVLSERIRGYHGIEQRQAQLFNNPEKGMIIGEVVDCQEEHFTIVSRDGTKWKVMNENIPEFKQHNIADGQRFVVIGKKIDNETFVACDVRGRGIVGQNKQLHNKQLQRMKHLNNEDCEQDCKNHMKQMSNNIEAVIHSACTEVGL